MARSALLFVFVLVGLLRAADSEEEPFKFPTMDDAKRIQQRHLKGSIMGKVAGGLSGRIGHLADGRVLTETRSHVQFQRENDGRVDVFRVASHALELLAADGHLLAKRSTDTEAGVVSSSESVYGEKHVDLTFHGPGGTYRKRLEIPADHDSSYRVQRELVAAWKPGAQPTRTYSSLSVKRQRFDSNTLTLLGKSTYQHDGTNYPAWSIREVDENGTVGDVLLGEDLLPMQMSAFGGAMKAVWVNEPVLEAEVGGGTLSSYVKVDRAVAKMLELESLELRLHLDPPQAPEDPTLIVDGPYQTAVREANGYRLTLKAQRVPAEAAALTLPMQVADPAVARHLAATPEAQSDHAEIATKAQAIAGETKDASTVVRKIVGWVWSHVDKVSGARGSATALEVLQACKGDCTEHAVLVVALCRAAGIPARNVGGMEYLSYEGKALAGFHAWAEVWLGRWIPVDATIPEVGTSARYVFLDVDEPGEAATAGSLGDFVTRQVRLEVLAWTHAGRTRVEAPKEPAPAGSK